MFIDKDKILQHINKPVFKLVGSVADELNMPCYVVGGYVRDIFLDRPNDDIDFVTVGSGIELATAVAQRVGKGKASLAVYKNYGTAQVKFQGIELEFVGARRESYHRESRNPIVEDGTLEDDQCRRDFTINAMAISVNSSNFGQLIDPFDGLGDLDRKIIRTPLDPDITFSDDPLRMMRAVRFATQLGFDIYPTTFQAMHRNRERIHIITRERIAVEMMKIVGSRQPSRGFVLLKKCGLLKLVFPELDALSGVDNVNGRAHKDNFLHTMQVLDNVAQASDNQWLRWAAIMHDIGKPATKRWDDSLGWTFHGHNTVGERMVPRIFAKMRLPLNEHMKYVKKLVGLHMRPIALVEDEVTDSAVRRLLFDAGDDIDDLMILCNADITSKNEEKVKRFRENFTLVKQKLVDIEEKDRVRNFQPPVNGEEIMTTFGLQPSLPVGIIKDAIKDAILDGVISNDYAQAYEFMLNKAAEIGITPTWTNELRYQRMPSPIGTLIVGATIKGIAFIEPETAISELLKFGKKLHFNVVEAPTPLIGHCIAQLNDYFAGTLKQFSLPLHLEGTEFQLKAWAVLAKIPYGSTITYAQQAEATGNAKATRAVAGANNANRIIIVLPCHRVIGTNGSLTGYGCGIEIKKYLLDLESNNSK